MQTCPVCGEVKEYWEVLDIGEYPYCRYCACQRRELAERRAKRNRKKGASDPLYASMTFSVDDGGNPTVSDIAKRYVEHFDEMRKSGAGLLLYGGVGTGKTFFAACIVNALIDKGEQAIILTSSAILRTPFQAWDDKVKVIEESDLFALDDLGAERDTEFAGERLFDAVDARIRSASPLIITTNLSPNAFGQPANLQRARIYDRIRGACIPVEIIGKSRRTQQRDANMQVARELLLGEK